MDLTRLFIEIQRGLHAVLLNVKTAMHTVPIHYLEIKIETFVKSELIDGRKLLSVY